MNFSIWTFAAFVALISGCGNKQETASPQKRSITEVAYASCNLYPENEYKLFANKSGYVNDVFMSEDDSVRLNQELFLIDVPNRNSESDASAWAVCALAKVATAEQNTSSKHEFSNIDKLPFGNPNATFRRPLLSLVVLL